MAESELVNELLEDSKEVVVNLADVTALARKQLELEAVVASAEEKLKTAKADLRKIQEGELPAALKAAGIPSFELTNGMTVSYSEDLSCKLPKARLPAIIKRMKSWGYEANVANTMTIDLGKGNNNTGAVLEEKAKELGLDPVIEETIPTGTVKKALRERIKEGENDDLTFFGAFSLTKSTIK